MTKMTYFMVYVLFLAACGETKEEDAQADAVIETETQTQNEPGPNGDDLRSAGLIAGLPSFCKASEEDEGCYTCDIQSTPVLRCIGEGKAFDFTKNCQHDRTTLECKEGNKTVHSLNLTGPMELQILNFVPIAVLTARTFVNLQIKGEARSKERQILLNALDFISTNIRKFVLLEDLDTLKDDVVLFATTQHGILNVTEDGDPEPLPENVKKDVEMGTDAVLEFFQEKRKTGRLELLDGLDLAKEISKAIPSLKLEETLSKIDFKNLDITAILNEILQPSTGDSQGTDP